MRRALLHSAHIYTVSPNSRVLLYKTLLYLCVLTVVMFIQYMSIDICIYNTASLTKNNSTVTFIIHSCVLCLIIITIIMITRITKDSCVSNRTETAGCVRNENCLPAEEWIALFSSLWVSVSLSWGKTFCAMLEKERAATRSRRALCQVHPPQCCVITECESMFESVQSAPWVQFICHGLLVKICNRV